MATWSRNYRAGMIWWLGSLMKFSCGADHFQVGSTECHCGLLCFQIEREICLSPSNRVPRIVSPDNSNWEYLATFCSFWDLLWSWDISLLARRSSVVVVV